MLAAANVAPYSRWTAEGPDEQRLVLSAQGLLAAAETRCFLAWGRVGVRYAFRGSNPGQAGIYLGGRVSCTGADWNASRTDLSVGFEQISEWS